MMFRDLPIGATFDFIDDAHPTWNTFYERCTKVSERGYTYVTKHPGETEPDRTLRANVGTINAEIWHAK